MNLINNKKQEKGFALTQVILALAISSFIAGIVTYSYIEHSKAESYQEVTSVVTQNSENSLQQKVIGQNTDQNITINGYKIATISGTSTITSVDRTACNDIAGNLKTKGSVTADCNNSTSTNSIVFIPNSANIGVRKNLAVSFNAGTPDGTNVSTIVNPNLNGSLNVASIVSNINAPTTGGTFSSNGGTLGGSSISSGNNGSLGGSTLVGSGGITPPNVYTGSGSITPPTTGSGGASSLNPLSINGQTYADNGIGAFVGGFIHGHGEVNVTFSNGNYQITYIGNSFDPTTYQTPIPVSGKWLPAGRVASDFTVALSVSNVQVIEEPYGEPESAFEPTLVTWLNSPPANSGSWFGIGENHPTVAVNGTGSVGVIAGGGEFFRSSTEEPTGVSISATVTITITDIIHGGVSSTSIMVGAGE